MQRRHRCRGAAIRGAKGRKGETESVAGGRRETAKGDAVASPFLRYLSEVRLLLNFLYAGYANFYATVRSQAGDQLSLGLDAVTLGAGDRVGFATTFDGNLAGSHALADQEVGNGAGTSFRQLLVVSVGTDTVGVTNNNGVAVFRLELNDLLVQSVQGLHAFGLQAVFAKGEQHVGVQGEVLLNDLRSRGRCFFNNRGRSRRYVGSTERVVNGFQGRNALVGLVAKKSVISKLTPVI